MLRGQTISTKYSPTWEKTSTKEVKEQVENGRRLSLAFLCNSDFAGYLGDYYLIFMSIVSDHHHSLTILCAWVRLSSSQWVFVRV
ncbi:hypothetical protein PoB_006512000 [Plakobranchus ocellatus]|uniref:Uncharacterized protein n=1 Tax=Plakobranchus ocellatus TaxID=259542 RepID=A0AAV4D3D8_9GAST|nr:hypothetical protein PoB_006512000 [Plakobranchus ocellatus]